MKLSLKTLLSLFASASGLMAMPMISEVMLDNTKTLLDEDNQYSDWIEISNPTAAAIRLEKYFLTDDQGDLEKWELPKIDVPAGGYLVVFASGKNRVDPTKKLHSNFKLSSSGEWIALVDPDGKKIISQVSVPPLKADTSYSLVDGTANAFELTTTATPGATNNKEVVLFSALGKTFTDAWQLTLSSPSGAQILYTTNGKTPKGDSTALSYTGPIDIKGSVIISAQVNDGPVSQQSYIQLDPAVAGVTSNLPLVVVDSPKTISSQTALTEMIIGIIEPSGDDKRAKMLGNFSVNSRGAIRVRGETSASNPKRPYRLEFWNGNGGDRALDVFGMGAESDWLLNMQQTFDTTLMHNAWIYKMSNEMGQYAVEQRFVEVYHNQKTDGLITPTDYVGVYEWMENITRGPDRVDIAGLPIGFDVKLVNAAAEADIPIDGRTTAFVARLDGKLKFRVFDSTAAKVIDTDEATLVSQAATITSLKTKLEPLWAADLAATEKPGLLVSLSGILGYPMSYEGRAEPSISGGYLFKQDKDDPKTWVANGGGVAIQIIYPPEEEKTPRKHQQDWLVAHLNKVRTVTNTADYDSIIDTRAWIDHHWLGFLPLNVDALRLSAYFHKDRDAFDKNGIQIRGKLAAGPIWDFDRSAGGPSDDRVTKPNVWRATTSDLGTHFFGAANGTPVWWVNLFKQQDFQTAWVDRWWDLRKSNFSLDNINRIIDGFATELTEAQDRNFKKWTSPRPRTSYANEVNLLKTWLKTRVEWLDSQMITVPKFSPSEVISESEVGVTLEASGGSVTPAKIYYTTDGSDPRAKGGAPSATAKLYEGQPILLNKTTRIIARKNDPDYKPHKDGPTMFWSGPASVTYFVGAEPASTNNLVISEMMYNPDNPSNIEKAAGFTDADAFEYLELLNIGSKTVDLSSARISDGVDFRFADGTTLAAGQRLLLVANQAAFTRRYGQQIRIDGIYDGTLRNSGEEVVVRDYLGNAIMRFDYGDKEPWPTQADGKGNSLVLKSPTAKSNLSQSTSWVASALKFGSPGKADAAEVGPTVPGSGYKSWITANFSAAQQGDATISGEKADPDQDGLPNLVEYFLGAKPLVIEADKAPKASLTQVGQDWFLSVSYAAKNGLTDVKGQVELSADMKTWQTPPNLVVVSNTANADGTTTTVIRAAEALGQMASRYARLKVSLN